MKSLAGYVATKSIWQLDEEESVFFRNLTQYVAHAPVVEYLSTLAHTWTTDRVMKKEKAWR